MKAIGLLVSTIVLVFVSTCLSGFVFAQMWEWFVVAVFALPLLSIPQAIGLTMTARLGTSYMTNIEDQETKKVTEDMTGGGKLAYGFFRSVLINAMILFSGWIVTMFL